VRRGELLLEEAVSPSVADMSRKVALGEHEQRDLPRHAALLVGVVVELVHHHVVGRGAVALAQAHARRISAVQHRMGASRLMRRVAGEHPHVVGAEVVAEREELLVHQRLDGAGVDGAPPSSTS
jgi:hypothetical protein